MSRAKLTPELIEESLQPLKRIIRQLESQAESLRQADALEGRGGQDERASAEKKIRSSARRLMVMTEDACMQIRATRGADGSQHNDEDEDDDMGDDDD